MKNTPSISCVLASVLVIKYLALVYSALFLTAFNLCSDFPPITESKSYTRTSPYISAHREIYKDRHIQMPLWILGDWLHNIPRPGSFYSNRGISCCPTSCASLDIQAISWCTQNLISSTHVSAVMIHEILDSSWYLESRCVLQWHVLSQTLKPFQGRNTAPSLHLTVAYKSYEGGMGGDGCSASEPARAITVPKRRLRKKG